MNISISKKNFIAVKVDKKKSTISLNYTLSRIFPFFYKILDQPKEEKKILLAYKLERCKSK